ncbi:MAG: hypothetical protein Q7R95_09425 [bacterium]|nr:hypothetical protein [bacterium]
MYDVVRQFGVDYIYFDLLFLVLFFTILIITKKYLEIIIFFIGGLAINFLVDWGFWLHSGIREVILPEQFAERVFVFMLWFSLSYGVEYAYIFLMFRQKSNKLLWTLLIFVGWLSVAFFSQQISINDSTIITIRHMSDFRILRIVILFIGYGLLIWFKYPLKKIVYLFIAGFAIHFMMEFSLLVNGIRPGSLLILLENSFVEFNMGVPFFYLLYDRILKNKFIHE